MKRFACVLGMLTMVAGVASADQPVCTGDRHYDEAGQCCPILDPPTTTTTLPDPTDPCQCVCQPVVCPKVGSGDPNTPIVVTVNPCPPTPMYQACHRHKKFHKGDVYLTDRSGDTFPAACPRHGAPHRVWRPL